MFSLSDRQQSLVIAALLATVAFKGVRYWQELRREQTAPIALHDSR